MVNGRICSIAWVGASSEVSKMFDNKSIRIRGKPYTSWLSRFGRVKKRGENRNIDCGKDNDPYNE